MIKFPKKISDFILQNSLKLMMESQEVTRVTIPLSNSQSRLLGEEITGKVNANVSRNKDRTEFVLELTDQNEDVIFERNENSFYSLFKPDSDGRLEVPDDDGNKVISLSSNQVAKLYWFLTAADEPTLTLKVSLLDPSKLIMMQFSKENGELIGTELGTKPETDTNFTISASQLEEILG